MTTQRGGNMAKELKKVNLVTVGVGFTGGIAAAECARAGLSVVGLERGPKLTPEDFNKYIYDEWRYGVNNGLLQELSKETVTFRNHDGMRALPMRQLGSFLPGSGLGGSTLHWSGLVLRFSPYDFQIKSMTEERYGKNKLSADYTLQDWPLTYDELEPYYTRFEEVAGVAGESGNPFGGKRSKPYPLPPHPKTPPVRLFEEAAIQRGCHPYMVPGCNASQAYTNPYGVQLNPCVYCGFCSKFPCAHNAKSTPLNTVLPAAEATGNYEIRCNANVVEILSSGNRVTGVRYVDALTLEEFIQPADMVLLSSYTFNNAKLLMVSNIGTPYDPATGRGTLGKNYCYQLTPGVTAFFKDPMNLYAGAGILGMGLDDYNHDNFDHNGLDFIHGGFIAMRQTGRSPIGFNTVPPGTPSWGPEFKKASLHNFLRTLSIGGQGASMPHKNNYLSLDETYKDAYGLPLLKLTYNFTDADRAMFDYLTDRMKEIAEAMGPESVVAKPNPKDYSLVPYQTTHNTGGTIMGNSPDNSVVNSYLQHWDRENLFVSGAGNFPHNGGCNPTATVGALAYRCAEGMLRYSHKGGLLV